MSKGKDYFSKSLEKGLRILSMFDNTTRFLTQSEVARKLDLNMTSTYRYINTLVEMGYLVKDARTKEIRPSSRCLLFCNNLLKATDHLKLIREVVDEVHGRCNFSIEVAFAARNKLVRIYNREAEETFTYRLPDSTKNSFHNTALGKAFLSTLPHEELVARIQTMELAPRTDRTITDRHFLLDEILMVRNQGFATTAEEYLPGLLAIAAPLYDPISGSGVGAVSFDFSVMEHNIDEIREKYSELIIKTAARLSEFVSPQITLNQQRT
ncbi:MAG: IclR family transcriptional regulator [Desulforhopalus sp.]